MSVRFGGTVADFTISPSSGAPLGGGSFSVFTDLGITPAVLSAVGGAAIGNTVTSRTSGVYEFDAPTGTTVLYAADGAGGWIALTPRPDLAYALKGQVQVALTNKLLSHGDSIAFGKGQTADQKWGLTVAARLGGLVYDGRGQGGQTTSEVALRAGALDLVTAAAVTVPATTTAVPVTFATTGDWFADFYTFVGTLGGIPGTLAHDDQGDVTIPRPTGWTFTPAAAGTAVTLAAGAVFHCTESDNDLGAAWLVLCGTNNYQAAASSGNGTNVIRDLDLIVRRLEAAGNRRYIIFATHIRPGDGAAPERIAGKTLNNSIGALRYGSHWVDWQGFLTGPGMAFEGLTPTSGDLADIAAGKCPSALLDPDGTHPLAPQGWDILIELAVQAFARSGWGAAGAKPLVATSLLASAAPTLSGATASAITVTPDANTSAHGRHIQYRKTGATAVLEGPNTTGTTAVTLTGLDPGTSYDARTVPVTVLSSGSNASAYGTPSPWATASTTGTAPVVLASDSFNRADVNNMGGSTLDNNLGGTGTRTWTDSNTFLGISSGGANQPDVAGRQTVALTDVAVSDARVAVRIRTMPYSGTNLSIYTRCTAAGSGYYSVLIVGDGTARLNKHDGTTLTALQTMPAGSAVAGDIWEVRAVGTAVSAIRNGAVVMSATADGTVPAGTKVGFNLPRAASVDDFTVFDK